jgi:hypothetical protein
MIFSDHFNRFAPSRFLTVINLPQIQDLPLYNTLPMDSTSLNDAPIAMGFAIFDTGLGTEKHTMHFQKKSPPIKYQGRHYRRTSVSLLRTAYFISMT